MAIRSAMSPPGRREVSTVKSIQQLQPEATRDRGRLAGCGARCAGQRDEGGTKWAEGMVAAMGVGGTGRRE
eukprot:767961-Hanusia_phi.AAC.2